VPGLPVHLDRPPHSCRLLLWGRADDGWWGLVVWEQRVRDHGTPVGLALSAWVPAQSLRKPAWASGEPIPRITLTGARQLWPQPAGWSGHYLGAWATGGIPFPPGVTPIEGPAWRR
jgi:hypothetical protein